MTVTAHVETKDVEEENKDLRNAKRKEKEKRKRAETWKKEIKEKYEKK